MNKLLLVPLALLALSCSASPHEAGSPQNRGAVPEPEAPDHNMRAQWAAIPDAELPRAPEGAPQLSPSAVVRKIAVGSCNEETIPIPLLGEVLAEQPDLFLYMGDNVYGDADAGDMRLPELRQAYADLAANPDFRQLWLGVPVLATWDDHDYGLNDAGADFAAREFAARIFRHFWHVAPNSGENEGGGVHRMSIYGPPGQRVQVILLDTRYSRSPLKPSPRPGAPGMERYVPDPDPSKTMLGKPQWEWLERSLREPAEIRLLVSSIQVIAEGHGWEAWRNLPHERERLFRTITDSGARGVLLLSGDRHRAGLYQVQEKAPYPLVELTASSLNLPFTNDEEPGPNRIGPTFLGANYGLIEIDWEQGLISLSIRESLARPVLELQVAFAALGLEPPTQRP